MPKFWQNSSKFCKKKIIIKKNNFSFFPELCTNSEVHANPPIWGNYTTLPETCLLSVFQQSQQYYLKRVISVIRNTLKRMQTNQYEEIE